MKEETANGKVFIVEDEDSNALMIENSILKSLPDMEIHRFKSIERAISQNKLNPDIIILDHFLEHTNGIDAIPVIKDFIQSASIVVLSSQTDPTLYSVAFQEGAKEYITKDKDMYQNLVAFIRGEMEARNTSLPFWKTIFSDWLSSANDKIKNVAIVDDDESILLTLEHNLSQTSRIHVHTFISFNGFLTEYKLIPDVIILDYKVGKTLLTQEVIAQVKKRFAKSTLVCLSTNSDINVAIDLKSFGIHHYLQKSNDSLVNLRQIIFDN